VRFHRLTKVYFPLYCYSSAPPQTTVSGQPANDGCTPEFADDGLSSFPYPRTGPHQPGAGRPVRAVGRAVARDQCGGPLALWIILAEGERAVPIPPLQKNGFLPPGLHSADLDEIRERFGRTSERRRMLSNRLQIFVDTARYVEARRVFVAGSDVTAKMNPRDVDVVIWVGERFLELLDPGDEQALNLELMFLTREPKEAFAVFDEDGWSAWLNFFSLIRSREGEWRGLVEVIL